MADASRIPWFSRVTAKTALTFDKGDILNIRDIEQSLENLKRVPSSDANIEILPASGDSAALGESDIKITYKQTFPFRLNLGINDSGSKATGKWQGTAALSWDNLFSANDLLYGSFSHSLKRHSDDDGARASESHSLYYSVPFGYWLFSASFSRNQYHQQVFGAFNNNYLYSGETQTTHANLSYMLYRDGSRKTRLAGGFWSRHSKNYIDGSEIDVQHRRLAGWEANISHTEYLGESILSATLGYKRGTGIRKSEHVVEERRNEGTSRLKIISADISLTVPFRIGNQRWQFTTDWQSQWNKTPLILADRLSIGGRYTVRGFDGELTLTGDRGWIWRNDISWNAFDNQWIYLALDAGRVKGGANRDMQSGNHLVGTAMGIKGGWKGFYYDFFVGCPLAKPSGFRTSGSVTGFNVGVSF
ncbi:ShlB/FhaC/HecB family hemolysin secretion/activation protein [Pasteurellaceae bacterium LIM206]|nr:ShlB/FhaC/HecB family hemolysin secretion/activation protein [Pasteurellaceae bacterium LIM206]